jgi:hypothetical protein
VSTHAEERPRFEVPVWSTPRRVIVGSLALAGVGLVLCVAGLFVDAHRAFLSYLDVWTFGASICTGALLLLMVGHAAKAGWMVVTRRLSEAVVGALPLYLVLFVPLAFGLRYVYPWAEAPALLDPLVRRAVEHKRGYLNPPFFVGRTVFYFAVFIAVGLLLRAWSTANDRDPSIARVRRLRRLSGGALPLVGLTLTWASFDWTMSLEPEWSSTIFGLYFFAGSFAAAVGLVAVMLHGSRLLSTPRLRVTPDHAHALGRVLFAMVCFWAYMAFSQLLIQWIGNLPDEVGFYLRRWRGSWTAVTILLGVGHFVAPFFLLLNRRLKRRTEYVASLGAWMVLMHFVDVYWLVMPARESAGVRPHWLDLAAILFVGGLSSAWIVQRYLAAAPLPKYAPELAGGLNYEASQ